MKVNKSSYYYFLIFLSHHVRRIRHHRQGLRQVLGEDASPEAGGQEAHRQVYILPTNINLLQKARLFDNRHIFMQN
jgi:hypothetical protein